jgi:hypothetical protein
MALDSDYDLRAPWDRDELKERLKGALTEEPTPTRLLAKRAGCNVEQAKRMLSVLGASGEAVKSGDKRTRLWNKPPVS